MKILKAIKPVVAQMNNGMTVNERLYVSGLLKEFDEAVAMKNKVKVIFILLRIELKEKSIVDILKSLDLFTEEDLPL
jgi:hypothetical protein